MIVIARPEDDPYTLRVSKQHTFGIPSPWKKVALLCAPLIALYVGTYLSQILGAGATRLFILQFLSLFIEAAPFLLAGSIVSGLIEVFVSPQAMLKLIPKGRLPQALVGSCLGLIFPVCECGVVPVVRRLFRKGMPAAMGLAFLLGAPVLNPIVLFATYKAFGLGPMLLWRALGTLAVSSSVALLITPEPTRNAERTQADHASPRSLPAALRHAADDFLGISAYLVIGALLASIAQVLIPQTAPLPMSGNALSSVVAMEVLAFILSLCSTVDAFIALGFASTFTGGSVLAFLVFGPMVDIKSTLMFIGIFSRRTVLQLILLPLLLSTVLGVALNVFGVF